MQTYENFLVWETMLGVIVTKCYRIRRVRTIFNLSLTLHSVELSNIFFEDSTITKQIDYICTLK